MAPRTKICFASRVSRLGYLPGMHCLEVPVKVVQSLGGSFKVRLICTLPRKVSFQCGLMSLGAGRGYIMLSKKRMKDAGLSEGDRPRVELQVDTSKYGMKMPAELKELLAQDTEGKTCFNALTRGNQRYIIHYVSQPKSEALRLERAMPLIGKLKRLPKGREFFRDMLAKPEVNATSRLVD